MRNEVYTGKYPSVDFHKGDSSLWIRQCTCCGEQKPINDFHRNGLDENGTTAFRAECKVCFNLKRHVNTAKNKKRHTNFVGFTRTVRNEQDIEYTRQEWKECLLYFGGECAYCGATPRRGKSLTRDHLLSVDSGGKTIQSNIVPACQFCNSSKGPSDFKLWYMAQSFFSQERLNKIFKWRSIIRQVGYEYEEEEV